MPRRSGARPGIPESPRTSYACWLRPGESTMRPGHTRSNLHPIGPMTTAPPSRASSRSRAGNTGIWPRQAHGRWRRIRRWTYSRRRPAAAPSQIERSTSPLRPSAVAPARPEPEDPVLAPSPRLLDPSLALRLYVPGPPPAQPYTDTPLSAGITPQDRLSLMLHLEPWTGPPTPPTAADDATLKSAVFAGTVTSLSPAAAGATPAALQTQSLRPPQPIATGANSTAITSDHDMPQSDATPPVPESTAPQSGSTALASELSRPEPSAARPPSPSATPSAAQSHPLPEPEAPAAVTLDHSPPTTLTLTLGQSRRLHLDHDATTVLVASPEIADVRLLAPNVLYVIGKGVGRTSVAVLDDNNWIEERVVAVVLDLEPLRTILAGEPDLSGVRARRLSRGMALTGEVASVASADRALRLAAGALPEGVPIENELRVAAPQQVNLEVQIAEVHRSVTEDLGVNWESFGIKNSERFGFRIGRAMPPVGGELGLGAFPPTLIGGNLASSIFFGSEGPLGQFRVMIDALATAGLANVLARPNVTAISGESASFFSGGEFPLPTGFDNGVLVFSYKKYGVLLDFVPTVVDTGRIVLTVRPEVSEPSLNQSVTVVAGVNVPVINVRRAETTVEVGDGESIVIAGLFRNTIELGRVRIAGTQGRAVARLAVRTDLGSVRRARADRGRHRPAGPGQHSLRRHERTAGDVADERLSLLRGLPREHPMPSIQPSSVGARGCKCGGGGGEEGRTRESPMLRMDSAASREEA